MTIIGYYYIYIFNVYYYIMILQCPMILLAIYIYINEEIETVEESNDESKIAELEKENELCYIRMR